MGTGSSDKNYLIELDCSRDLAAIFILVYHFIIESNTAGYIHFSPFILQMFSFWGSIGVNLFFLLSGASLTHRWQNRWNLKEYVKGRILAIYPDFWVISFLYLSMEKSCMEIMPQSQNGNSSFLL